MKIALRSMNNKILLKIWQDFCSKANKMPLKLTFHNFLSDKVDDIWDPFNCQFFKPVPQLSLVKFWRLLNVSMDLRILGNGSLTDLSWILSLWGRILSDTNFQISQTTVSPPHSSSHWQDIFRYFSNHIFREIVSKHIFLWSPTTNILPDIFQNIYLALQISHHISSNKISQDESVAISRARISSSHFVAARV